MKGTAHLLQKPVETPRKTPGVEMRSAESNFQGYNTTVFVCVDVNVASLPIRMT